MTLSDVVARKPVPLPWEEGDNIPWDEPAFSARMLREHLNPAHDLASRRAAKVDAHVEWIHSTLLGGRAGRVLDLACGPGLYAVRLAALGHDVVGIDFSPASVEHARKSAGEAGLECRFLQADLRSAAFGDGFDLAMLLYGQFNVFRREEARSILERAHAALRPGGQLLLEPQDFDGVKREGQAGSSWFASPGGLFSEGPHLVLEEAFWDESERAATTRLHVVDAATAAVTRYALSSAAYTDGELAWLLDECGFTGARFHGPLAGVESPEYQFFALSATRV